MAHLEGKLTLRFILSGFRNKTDIYDVCSPSFFGDAFNDRSERRLR
jgi:hypothetical protein